LRPNYDSSTEKMTEKEIDDHFGKDIQAVAEPINRKLNFDEENNSTLNRSNNEINMYVCLYLFRIIFELTENNIFVTIKKMVYKIICYTYKVIKI